MKMNMGGRVTPHDRIVRQDDQRPRSSLSRAIGVMLTVLAFVAFPAFAQFTPGQVLRAVDLNNAISKPAIIGGSIDGAPIGAATPNSGKFTSLSATGTATLNSLSSSGATITGGSINGAPIGQSTAAAGAFTALTATGSFTATGLVTNADLAAQAANTVLANVTGSTASPTAFAMPSCNGTNNALRWTAGTGFTCASSIALTSSGLNQFASTTSAQLAGVISDETGSGSLVFGTNPTLAGASVTSTLNVTSTSPLMNFNATSGSTLGTINFQAAGLAAWQMQPTTALYSVCRYSSGTFVDCPFTISNSTGIATFGDGIASNGTISGTGFSNYLASPPAIGGTTANTGAFTNLTSSGTVSGTGFNNYLTSTTAIGLIDSMTNAKAYGALGNSNGTHGNGNDDTTALQNALNASANGILHIPCGTYRITASLQQTSTNNYWVKGDGQCTKIYNDAATAVPTFVFNPSTANGNVNPTVRIEGIYFYNPYVTGAGQTAASFVNEERPYFLNNIIYGYQVGVNFTSTYAPVIDHNTFFRTVGSAIDCSIDTSCNSATISQNGFFTNGLVNSAPAINLNTPSSLNAISITGNDMEANYSGILFSNVFGAVVSGNYIENQTACNLCFNSGNSSIDFNGNWLGASPSLTLTNGLSNSTFQNNATYNYAITQGTSTSVRQINNTAVGTGGISLPTVGQLNSNTTSGTSMTSNTPTNCTSITLPAGTWDVSGSVQFSPATSTVVNYMHSSISLTSATVAPLPNRADVGGISATGNTVGSMSLSTPVVRETFATSTPVYLVGNSTFTTSSMTCNGYIRAVLVQ
ncbi:beta strand repeat-containing protein [Burkholderia vietnamiensis]|uniref:beta strand repeat-containing protein n=1 Tax=Burkholderia vietnamiensis TaxID=60552 RepID=UPI001592F3C5|nr:hypothetical protein [Burkholderia vietnamiensis]